MKQLGEGWNWRELKIGNRFITYGRTLFEADLLNFVTLCGFSEELFTNKEYVKEHAPMRGGHPVPNSSSCFAMKRSASSISRTSSYWENVEKSPGRL